MANCESFRKLSMKEKIEFVGKLNHVIQNDEQCFRAASKMLNHAQDRGILDDVVINPSTEERLCYIQEPDEITSDAVHRY